MTKITSLHGQLLFASAKFRKAEKADVSSFKEMPLDKPAEFAIVFAKEGLPTTLGLYFDPSAWEAGAPLLHLMSHDLAMYPLGAGRVEHADDGRTAMMVGTMRASAEQDPEIMAYASSYNSLLQHGVVPEASAGFFAEEVEAFEHPDENGQWGRVTKADGIEVSRVYRGAHPETSVQMYDASAKLAAQYAQGAAIKPPSDALTKSAQRLEQMRKAEWSMLLEGGLKWI